MFSSIRRPTHLLLSIPAAATLAASGIDPVDAETKRARYKQLLAAPLLFSGFTDAAQVYGCVITAAAMCVCVCVIDIEREF